MESNENISKTVSLLRQAVAELEQDPQHQQPSTSTSRRMVNSAPTTPSVGLSSEIRKLFTPYNKFNHSQSKKTSNQPVWSHKFICLSDPEQDYVPNKDIKMNLLRVGLGEKRLVLEKHNDPGYLKESLISYYPKLKHGGGYELLRTCNRTCLEIIPPPRTGYTTCYLADSCSLGQSMVFIRPLQKALSMENTAFETEPSEDCPMEKCLICQEQVPVIQLKSHIKDQHEADRAKPDIDELPVINFKKRKITSICDDLCKQKGCVDSDDKNTDPQNDVCPICFKLFNVDILSSHAATCFEGNSSNVTAMSESSNLTLQDTLDKLKLDVFPTKGERVTISVLRQKFIETAMENIEEFNFKEQMNIIFVGEDGVDAGGLTREFFSLLFKETPIFENGVFKVNSTLLSNNVYKTIGKAVSFSVLTGNQGPQCLRPHIVNFILYNITPTEEDIPSETIPLNVLHVLKEINHLDDEGLGNLLTEYTDVFEAANFSQKLNNRTKKSAVGALVQHFGFYRYLPAMLQFIEGLKLHSVFDAFLKFPMESSAFLSIGKTTFSEIIEMFQPSYSLDQEDKKLEEIIVYNFHQFLRKLQRGKIISEWVDLNEDIEDNNPVTLKITDFLQATTGSSSITSNIKTGLLLFDHKSEKLTTVNTCAPSITFSQVTSMKDYDFFQKSMINVIVGAYGFGIN